MAAQVYPRRRGWNAAWERAQWVRIPGKGWVKRPPDEAEQRYVRTLAERKEVVEWER